MDNKWHFHLDEMWSPNIDARSAHDYILTAMMTLLLLYPMVYIYMPVTLLMAAQHDKLVMLRRPWMLRCKSDVRSHTEKQYGMFVCLKITPHLMYAISILMSISLV